ncbi:hypothetical protein H4582DRAFT_196131 [Lactarius indigo]|nr:hypothetical protein H4582DRAFT_196131 [Lactarius indigo]
MVKIPKFSGPIASLFEPGGSVNKPLHHSGITYERLADFNVTPHGRVELSLKPGYEKRAAMTSVLGKEELWSSTHFHQHLEVLQDVVPNVNNASARRWIEPFLFRTSAMVSSNKRMILSMEQVVQQTPVNPSDSKTLTGCINYTAVLADNDLAKVFLSDPTFKNLGTMMPCGFFVAEANPKSANLMVHVPQAIGEMYACAKNLKKNTLRGALSDGNSWMFLIIVLNPDGNGANFRRSSPIEFQRGVPSQIVKPWPDVLTGILLHWIENSYSDIGSDDWFEDPA